MPPMPPPLQQPNADLEIAEEVVRLRQLLDNVGAYVYAKDTEGRYTYVNGMVRALFGVPQAEIIGASDEKFFDLARSADLRRHDRRVIDNGERIEREEHNVIAATGESRYYLSVKEPLRDSRGKVVGMFGISTDITEYKRVAAGLRESETRFKAVFEQAPLGLWLLDHKGRVIDCNDKFARYIGASREEILGFDVLNDSRDRSLIEPVTRALNGEPSRIETAYTSTAGRRSSVYRFYFQPVFLADELAYVLGFAEDIGAVKRAEDMLLARESLLTQIMDTASVAIFLVNGEGIITHANQCMAELFRQPLDELIGTEYVAHVHPSERDVGRARMLALLASDIPSVDLERLYWRNDGTEFWGRLTGRRFHDNAGEDRGLVGVIADIDDRRRAVDALVAAEAQFRDLVDSTPGIVWEADARSNDFTYVSQEAERLLGYPAADWLQPGFWPRHLHPDDRDWAPRYCAERSARLEAHAFEYRFIASDGRVVWLRDIVKVVAEDGAPRWLRGVMIDVTESKRASERLRGVVNAAMDGLMILNGGERITECNEALCDLTGHTRQALLRMTIGDLDPSAAAGPAETDAPTGVAGWIARIVAVGSDRFESRWRRWDGALIDVEVTASHLPISQEICVFVRDISQAKAHERELDRIAHFDALTGVPNRTLLADRMRQAVAQTKRAGALLAVCYIDLDGFKPVNDQFGHAAGDSLLVQVARRLASQLRGGDTLARIGGDEFIVLLQGMDGDADCEVAVTRLLEAMRQPFVVAAHEVMVSASIGVALYPRDDVDVDTLLRHADQAMYQAKESGKNRFHVFDAEHDRLARDRALHLAHIGRALENEEFVLYFQPVVDMRAGAVLGAEALIRWQHPERGLLPPAEFLPSIENNDLIVAIGDWVIASALAQLQEWWRQGLHLRVSVNIAARHLLREDFVPRLQAHLAACPEVPPAALTLEILETAALEDVGHVSALINACRALGVEFALDDFGTGYSSLSYLKQLPAGTLKIDRGFVCDMLVDAEDRAIVEGIVGLAGVFRRKVIAEGVETAAHGALLVGLGCDVAQGYGIARPMPAAAVAQWIAGWRPDSGWCPAPAAD